MVDCEQHFLLCLSHVHPVDLLACTLVSKATRQNLLSDRVHLFRSAARRIGVLLTTEAFLRAQPVFGNSDSDGKGTAIDFIREIDAWAAEADDLGSALGADSQLSHGLLRTSDSTNSFTDPPAVTCSICEHGEQHKHTQVARRWLGPSLQMSHEAARFYDSWTYGLRFDTAMKACLNKKPGSLATAVIEMKYCKEECTTSPSKKNTKNKVKFVLDVIFSESTSQFIRLRRRSFSYVSLQCSSAEWCPCLPRASFQHLMSMHPYSALRGCDVTFVTTTPAPRTTAITGRQLALFYELVERYQFKGQPSWVYFEGGHELQVGQSRAGQLMEADSSNEITVGAGESGEGQCPSTGPATAMPGAHDESMSSARAALGEHMHDQITKSAAAAIWFHAPPLHRSAEAYIIGPSSCLSCGQTQKLRKCMGCKRVAFCNATCQRAVWDAHKSDCKYLKLNCSDRHQYHGVESTNGWNQPVVGIRKFVYNVGEPLDARSTRGAPDVRVFLGMNG
jgi:hypothetical protein